MLRRSIRSARNIMDTKDLGKLDLSTKDKNQSSDILLTKVPLQEECNIRRLSNDSDQSEESAKHFNDQKRKSKDSSMTDTSAEEVENNHDSDTDSSKYPCPICNVVLATSHDFTGHIRSHNINENEHDYTCKICFKMLSSNSSLDRHILVHSGERPFRCRVCAVTFNTNGNMHRHMRTHDSNRTDSCESDGSSDSNNDGQDRQRLENNNNRVLIKRKYDQEESDSSSTKSKRRCKTTGYDSTTACPVCGKDDFPTTHLLEQHVQSEHPNYEVECGKCDMNFKNFRALHRHRFMKHEDATESIDDKTKTNTVVGFSDLTFVDFSAEKFPHIARAACELNIHTPSNGNISFKCSRCPLAFPCSSALEIHKQSCKAYSVPQTTNDNKIISEEDIKREDFFATLNLQNKSAQVKIENKKTSEDKVIMDNSNHDIKDLADIQSIIHMASAKALLKQLSSKPQDALQETNKDNQGEEEAQDLFSAEFRKMKLRGEFPCRLCTAIFPNLRALKGHNRLHLTGNGPGPYRCNMCPHSSTDKAALVRHMRTHNGDRPYECAICNYAFTTKANCERHLRNRHAKVTREEVKRSIVYHPSEDPNNDDIKREQSSHIQTAQPTSSVFGTPETDPESAAESFIPNDRSTPVSHLKSQRPTSNNTAPRDLSIVIPQCNLAARILEVTPHAEQLPVQKIHVKSLEQLSRFPQYMESEDSDEDEYHPIDLSMDALDLSKKSKPEDKPLPVTPVSSEQNGLSKNGLDFISEQAATAMLQIAQQQQRLKGGVGPAASFYAAQLQQWYRGGFPLPPTSFNPFFLPASSSHPFLTPPSNAQDIVGMKELEKEIIRGLQLSGGSLIMNNMALATERLQAFQQQAFNMAVAGKVDASPANDALKNPLLINTALPTTIETTSPYSPNPNSPISKTTENSATNSHSPGAVKMVIKNGVLMPKQKQRRYRTERPFSCEHCSARFTLRSNMERHVKQQHPQHWAQRQRTGGHIVRRGPVAHIQNELPIDQTEDQNQTAGFNNISEQVKYAILAQQLQRSETQPSHHEADDEDVELVIDEDVPEEKCAIKEESPTPMNDNSKARKVADEILQHAKIMEAVAGIKEKDFDLKIMSNLIPKSPIDLSRSDNFIPVATVKHNSISLDGKLALALSKNAVNKSTVEQNQSSAKSTKTDEMDLVSVSKLLDNANSQLPFGQFFRNEQTAATEESEGEEEGLVASGSASEGNNSGSDENRSESELPASGEKKKSAYSLAPNRVSCNYCHRKFPWSSSLRRHILTHTGQKPYKCAHCPLLFTTKSNCDRHLLRKHGHLAQQISNSIATSDNMQNNREEVNNMGFITRNVPERPFKCSSCPSSTFSTINNLKKHMSCKHSNTSSSTEQLSGSSRPNSPTSEIVPENISDKKEKMTDWEAQIGSKTIINENQQPSNVQNSDFPFKCHLCEGSYPERQVALDHIKDSHFEEYELLVSKGAMDTEQDIQGYNNQHEENDETNCEAGKGRFPDYANRKVICAFCMRRFWSAEDLRRHMRTHSGVRPFQCDVCRRRFTLKHSMLRHRKKHDTQARHSLRLRSSDGAGEVSAQAGDSVSETSDEEAKVATANRVDGDLIGNLLGISDRGILNKVLFSSAHEAAKLLGVEHRK